MDSKIKKNRTDLAIKMAKLVHSKCLNVPHDIGLQLLFLIDEHECLNCKNCVNSRDEFEPNYKCPEHRRKHEF